MAASKEALSAKEISVFLGEIGPFIGKIVSGEDSRNRAHRHTGTTIDALYRVNIEHFLALELFRIFFGMNAVDRTSVDTGSIFGSDARFGNYVSHLRIPIRS